MSRAVIVGGSRGIGRAIADALRNINYDTIATSRKELDTSDPESVERFLAEYTETDILVLNTGGPPPLEFQDITRDVWSKYHEQLFLGFCDILKGITVNDGGYIFVITSMVTKEPSPELIISSAYRTAFGAVLKALSKEFAARNISTINIAPGPIRTDRTKELVSDIDAYAESLPMKRLGEPEEIGNLVKSIVQNEIKYLSGTTISFDGAGSSGLY